MASDAADGESCLAAAPACLDVPPCMLKLVLDNALFSSRMGPFKASYATGPPCSSITPVATLMTVVVVPVMIPIAFSPGVVAVATP
jgi:hypothetical protein